MDSRSRSIAKMPSIPSSGQILPPPVTTKSGDTRLKYQAQRICCKPRPVTLEFTSSRPPIQTRLTQNRKIPRVAPPSFAGDQEIAAAAQSLTQTGTEQTKPRFISGLPFDDPLSTGGFGNLKENAVWVERSTNSLMVRATPQEHEGLADQIRVWDRQENQIQINTYVVEVSKNDDLFGGVDWSNTLGQNGATFTLTGNVGATPIGITSAGFGGPFFNNGLILKFPDVSATIRALAQRGKLRVDKLTCHLHQDRCSRTDQECNSANHFPADCCHRQCSGNYDTLHLHDRPNH